MFSKAAVELENHQKGFWFIHKQTIFNPLIYNPYRRMPRMRWTETWYYSIKTDKLF